MKVIKLTKQEAKDILKITFPDYTGRSFRLMLSEKVDLSEMLFPGGGTFSNMSLVKLSSNGDAKVSHEAAFSPKRNPMNYTGGSDYSLQLDEIVAEHSFFCGKDMGIIFHIHPDSSYLSYINKIEK